MSASLTQWLRAVYAEARQQYPEAPPPDTPPKRGRKWFSRAQAVAVAALMRRAGLTCREARDLFWECREYRRALHLRSCPSKSWFAEAAKLPTIAEKRELV